MDSIVSIVFANPSINQFKEAVTRLAESNNPVMLQNFLQQMHQITEEAIFSQQNQPRLVEVPEPTETEPTEPEPTNKAEEDDFVRNRLAIAQSIRDFHIW